MRFNVTERPLLHVCSGRAEFGDATFDKYEPADFNGDWTSLPFEPDEYAAVFADPPWNSGYKAEVAAFMREALTIARVAYLMAPWLYCASWAPISRVWWREFPGVHSPVLLSRYERAATQLAFDPSPLITPPRAQPWVGQGATRKGHRAERASIDLTMGPAVSS